MWDYEGYYLGTMLELNPPSTDADEDIAQDQPDDAQQPSISNTLLEFSITLVGAIALPAIVFWSVHS